MPVKIDLNKVIWTVQKPEVAEVYEKLSGKCCFNDNENCNEIKLCKCEPCHRCGNTLCVCPLVNEPYHTDCGPQLSCWCDGVEELDFEPIVVEGREEQGGPTTSNTNKLGGSGSSRGPVIQGKFHYQPQKSSNKGDDVYLGPQGGKGDDGFQEVKGKRGGRAKLSGPIPPNKRPRDDDTGKSYENIVNHPREGATSIFNDAREVEETERGDRVTVRDQEGNIKHQYLKDTVFEERVFNNEMWDYYRNLHGRVIRKEVERVSAVANPELTGYVLIPYLQYGTPQERLVNVYQSFSRVTIFDKNLNKDRFINLAGDNWDIRVQGTNAESMFLIHCRNNSILQAIYDLGTVKYLKKNKFARGEGANEVITSTGTIKIFMIQNPTIVYLASGATLDRIEDYVNSLQDFYDRRLGDSYEIRAVAEQKQIFYYPPGSNKEVCVNVKTGNIRVEFQQKHATIESNKVPHEGKFWMPVRGHNRKEIKVEMMLMRQGGARKCTFCKGSTCEWNKCNEQCRYCHIPLKQNPGHLESECSKLYKEPALIANNKRMSQRIQEFNDYLNQTPQELPESTWINEEQLKNIQTITKNELSKSRGSYASALTGAFTQGQTRAQMNKTDKEANTNNSDTAYLQAYDAKQQRLKKFKKRGRDRGTFVDDKSMKNVSEEEVLNQAMHENAKNLINNKSEEGAKNETKHIQKSAEKSQASTPEAQETIAMEEESSSEEDKAWADQMDDLMKGLETDPQADPQAGPMNLALNNSARNEDPPDRGATAPDNCNT